MRIYFRPWVFGFVVLPLLAACSDPTGSTGQRIVGIVEWLPGAQLSQSLPIAGHAAHPEASTVISAPDEVHAGVPFDATITTTGPSICWRADGEEIELSADLAVVTPYDFTPESEDVACGQAIIGLPRTITLTFTSAGEATLRVKGRKVVGGNLQEAGSATVEKKIFVR